MLILSSELFTHQEQGPFFLISAASTCPHAVIVKAVGRSYCFFTNLFSMPVIFNWVRKSSVQGKKGKWLIRDYFLRKGFKNWEELEDTRILSNINLKKRNKNEKMFYKKRILIGKVKLRAVRKRHALSFLWFAFCTPHFALCLTIDFNVDKYSLNII